MSREFPDWLNPWKAADGHRTFGGTMPLARMSRLAPLLAPQTPAGSAAAEAVVWQDARFRADFDHDREGTVTVRLQVEANLPLICQRSLAPYVEAVRRDSLLGIVESLEAQDILPEHYEPVLVEGGRMALQQLVEDELLLALPEVPRNPAVEAIEMSTGEGGDAADEPEQGRRPFRDLARLMKRRAGKT
jgi:DUF177 domain-containing protein